MHMSNALLSPGVGASMCAVSAAACVYAVNKIKSGDIHEVKNAPVVGVMGALVFAAQMVNFTIPATGSSGHIVGGILLAAIIGAMPAMLAISAMLAVQCLFFADGGLLAIGCNIFNMGVIPCLIVYPLVFKPLVKNGAALKNIAAASMLAVVASLQLGAFCVTLETQLSGVAALPFSKFLLSMQPIHLAIGIAEGVVTTAVLCFVCQARPGIMKSRIGGVQVQSGVSSRGILIAVIAAALIGGVLSLFASSHPDGLEWAIQKVAGTSEIGTASPVVDGLTRIQGAVAVMPDYNFKGAAGEVSGIGTSVAGVVGIALTFLLAAVAALVAYAGNKGRKSITAV
jgi:cobalt/nickel transport system permease protein